MRTILSIILSICAMLGCNVNMAVSMEVYPASAVVTEIDYGNDLVTVKNATGLEYEYYGAADYEEGDVVSLLMCNAGTRDTIEDDMILSVRFSGYYVEAGNY